MSTLYELFKVSENATDQEIKEAYDKILEKAESLPQSDKLIEQIRRVKIAYGILSNPEKRKKYDLDLATKRADELLQSVQVKEKTEENPIQEPPKQIPEIDEEKIKQAIDEQIDKITSTQEVTNLKEKLEIKRKQQLNNSQLAKEFKKQQKKEKRQAKKEQQLKREMEIQAYGRYLEKQGYKVKYPWTWPRVKRLIIAIFVVIVVIFVMWQIPFVRQTLTDLYNENFIIRTLVNMLISIFTSIGGAIKGIFE